MMAFILATDFDFIAYMSKMAFFGEVFFFFFSRQWRFWNMIKFTNLHNRYELVNATDDEWGMATPDDSDRGFFGHVVRKVCRLSVFGFVRICAPTCACACVIQFVCLITVVLRRYHYSDATVSIS